MEPTILFIAAVTAGGWFHDGTVTITTQEFNNLYACTITKDSINNSTIGVSVKADCVAKGDAK